MTIEELSKLSDEELRVRCAELCGYTRDPAYPSGVWNLNGDYRTRYFLPRVFSELTLPHYTSDLNAMHEAEELLERNDEARAEYEDILDRMGRYRATARQRCIAFIAVMQSA